MQINLKDNEMLCDLQCEGLFIVQERNGYRFTTDAVLLANFVDSKRNQTLVEFCAGSGVISILVNAKRKPKKIIAVEIQERFATLINESIQYNKISNIEVINSSLEDFSSHFKEKADAVIVNPPYYKTGSGRLPKNEMTAIAKYEVKTNLQSIIKSAKQILKPNGSMFLVFTFERKEEALLMLKSNGFYISKLQHVKPMENKPYNVVLIKAELKKCEKTEVMPDIIINNSDGSETDQIKEIYNRTPR